jgi:uncharacterized membrane protein YozB (DUF420 family)
MFRELIRKNILNTAVLLFLLIFFGIQYMHPAFLYNSDGSIRQFGVGYKNKTILPVWLLSFILGILCYLGVNFYVIHPRIVF